MTSSVFPDINVLIALVSAAHVHQAQALEWYESLREEQEIVFCRLTQLGLLRLLTQQAVMGTRVMTQQQAWMVYDHFLAQGFARFAAEPRSIEVTFRQFAGLKTASPKDWADSYLAAFAKAADLTLVTFDQALAGRAPGSVLLRT